MTPKEKAEDLWLVYYELIDDAYSNEAAKKIAKEYALIAVNEIIKNGGTKYIIEYKPNSYTNEIWFWEEVKQEIENL